MVKCSVLLKVEFKMALLPALFGLLLATVVTGNGNDRKSVEKLKKLCNGHKSTFSRGIPKEKAGKCRQVITIEPREVTKRVGENLTVLCKVNYPIDSCRITLGPTQTSYRLKPDESDDNDNIIYAGSGLEKGECGALIRHVTEDLNGNITCNLPPERGQVEVTATMRLIIARPPSDPELRGPSTPSFSEGDQFSAQCIVANGRPAAKISWFLDDNEIFDGIFKPVITSEPGSDLQTISQNMSRVLSADDNNLVLTCRAEHEALTEPREAKRQLIVYYPPKRLESSTITIFGLKLGAEGRLNVTVRANPTPRAEWTIGAQKIIASQTNDLGNVLALEPVHLGGGYYNITLLLSRIEKEDVDRKYYLRVSNDFGSEDFTVLISTLDEPTGVELGAGAIVGIVIAVLLLLISVTLVVFAKATDRWCFAGSRGRDNTKSSGESDTESAVGGRERSRLANLGARMRAVLPKAKDKVQATEAAAADTEEKPLSEEKKGVVYAELALGGQAATEKPPPPSTEYAEIVYTDQPKEPKE